MEVCGVKFAPLLIPLERRLQTASVMIFPLLTFSMGWLTAFILLYMLLFTKYYVFPLLYLAWYMYDYNIYNRGGRLSPWVRGWSVWHHLRDYFPVSLVKTADLDPKKNYIFGTHPHGIGSMGAFSNFGTDAGNFSQEFPGLRPHLLTLSMNFWLPVHREFTLATGMCSATKESMEWLLTREGKGTVLVLVVGGALEALDAHPGTVCLTLNRRKGFIKLALKHGASLVPVFSFGENELFDQTPNPDGSFLKKFQLLSTKLFGVSSPVFHGRGVFQYTFGPLPYRKRVVTVVGAPIDVRLNPNPSTDDIEQLHAVYIQGLKKLFNEHKDKYGYENVTLKIQ